MHTVAVMLYAPVGASNYMFITVAKKVTHQSMVHACALWQSINRRSMVGHSKHLPLSNVRTLTINGR